MPATDSTEKRCAGCGAAIPRDAPFGQCPRCVLGLGQGMMLVQGPGDDLLNAEQVRSFGDYELLEEIARGGMGVVYRARQLSLRREVAVKMLLAGALATTESVQRFRNEAAAVAALDHPHIVSVYEIGEHETQHYFSMRLVLGRQNIATWARALNLAPAQRWPRIVALMVKVARAVAFAHERGLLHRDLKPSNILVDDKGEPQVVDFGIARPLGVDSDFTVTGQMVGTPRYMAPEQARGENRSLTPAADTYALGAILYELLTDRKIFEGEDMLTLLKQVTEQTPKPPGIGERGLEGIVMRCLEKSPAQRYTSAAAFADDLERWLRHEPVMARSQGVAKRLVKWTRRHPAAAALAVAVALGSCGLLISQLWQPSPGRVQDFSAPAISTVESQDPKSARRALEWFHSKRGHRGTLVLEAANGSQMKVSAGATLPPGDFEIIELWLDHWQSPTDPTNSFPTIDRAEFRLHAAALRQLRVCFLRSLPLKAQDVAFLSHNQALEKLTIENCPGAGGATLLAQIAGLRKLTLIHVTGSEGDAGPLIPSDLAKLSCLPVLQSVYLMQSSLNDEGVALLAERCGSLRRIGLASTLITDKALRHINRRPLDEVRLDSNPRITDAGLAELAKIPSLGALFLRGSSNLTDAGVAAFRSTRPECRVAW